MKATIKNLRLRTAEVLAATDRGEEVIITYHGKPRARLTRWLQPQGVEDSAGRNPAFGIWRDRDDDVAGQVRRLRRRRTFS